MKHAAAQAALCVASECVWVPVCVGVSASAWLCLIK